MDHKGSGCNHWWVQTLNGALCCGGTAGSGMELEHLVAEGISNFISCDHSVGVET